MSRFRGFSKPVLLIDFESTGFENNSHGDVVDPGKPTQLGAVLLNPSSLAEEDSFLSDLRVDNPKISDWVLGNTDITIERLQSAPQPAEVASKFYDQFGVDVYLASWNIYFDRLWLDILMRTIGRRDTAYDYHHLDIWSLSYSYLCQNNRSDVIRSDEVFSLFGQSKRGAHNALDDCRRSAEVLRAVMFDKGVSDD